MIPRIGSLCTGYGGLDMAVQQVFGGDVAWTSDIDPGAARIVAHRHPGVPNHGDLTTAAWDQVEPVDIVTGGYPCQPFSNAGLRKGTEDERHIWPYIANALRVLRPRVAIFENVSGHLRLGFDTVLADLAGIGFDAEWCIAGASEVGAPHRRKRLFLLATLADAPDLGHEWVRGARGRRPGPAHDSQPAADTQGVGRGERRAEPTRLEGRPGTAVGGGAAAADTEGERLKGDPHIGGGEGARIGPDPDRRSVSQVGQWGRFLPAVRRWERVTGRHAPWATDDRNRLSPAFVEWLMGLPAGHVTDVPGLTRTQQLHALGNGVVPQQAAAALRMLTARLEQERAVA